jgi:hypothetical protein
MFGRFGWSTHGYESDGVPPWYQLDCHDLSRFIRLAIHDLAGAQRIIDIGGGLGLRSMLAVSENPELNRSNVHITCVDIAPAAIVRGMQLWESVRQDLPSPDLFHYSIRTTPRYSMSFRLESATDFPLDLLAPAPDLWIDWMMLHGLPQELWPQYMETLRRAKPRFIALKCFTREHGTLQGLPASIPGVPKHQFTDAEIDEIFGHQFERTRYQMDWPEALHPVDHTDGPVAAKRAYLLRRIE